jgi:hypothetical protein
MVCKRDEERGMCGAKRENEEDYVMRGFIHRMLLG